MQNYKGIAINSVDDYGTPEATTREINAFKAIIDRVPYKVGTTVGKAISGVPGSWSVNILALTSGMVGEVLAYSKTTDDSTWSGPSFMFNNYAFSYGSGGSGTDSIVNHLWNNAGPAHAYGTFDIDISGGFLRINHLAAEGKDGGMSVEYYVYLFNQ